MTEVLSVAIRIPRVTKILVVSAVESHPTKTPLQIFNPIFHWRQEHSSICRYCSVRILQSSISTLWFYPYFLGISSLLQLETQQI